MLHTIRVISYALIAALVVTVPVMAAGKGAADEIGGIKKCKDAAGRWHYGDRAARECAASKIEVLSEKGVTKKTIAAPPTEEELAERERRKDEIERQQRTAEEKAKRDKILLTTYGHEDDIALVRDRKHAQLEAQIKASEETVKSLRRALERMQAQKDSEKDIAQTTRQIERHEASIAKRREEQQELQQQYEEDLKRYRELRSGASETTNK